MGSEEGDMKTLSKNLLMMGALLLIGATNTGCGKSIVTDAHVKTYQQDGNAYGEVGFVFNTGSIQMPSFTFPIINPTRPGESFGSISMRPALKGGTDLTVAVNISGLPGIPGIEGDHLPNGKTIPIALPDDVEAFSLLIPAGAINLRIYLAFGDDTAMVGIAVPIKQFKELAKYIGSFDLFIPFQFDKVRGTGGIFSGPGDGQSGIAAFIDAGALLNDINVQNALVANGMLSTRAAAASDSAKKGRSRIEFLRSKDQGGSREQKLNEQLYKWNQKKQKMTLG
jgi:hypothetical protein